MGGRDLLDWWTGQLRSLLRRPARARASRAVDLDAWTTEASRTPHALRLPPGAALLRPLSPVPLPHADLASMAEMDVVAHTPLHLSDVHVVLFSDAYGLHDHQCYAIIKRTVLDGALRITRSAAVRGLLIGTPDGDRTVHGRSFDMLQPPPNHRAGPAQSVAPHWRSPLPGGWRRRRMRRGGSRARVTSSRAA